MLYEVITPETEIEPDTLGDKVVCPKMDFLKDQVFKAEPRQQRATEQKTRVHVPDVSYNFV